MQFDIIRIISRSTFLSAEGSFKTASAQTNEFIPAFMVATRKNPFKPHKPNQMHSINNFHPCEILRFFFFFFHFSHRYRDINMIFFFNSRHQLLISTPFSSAQQQINIFRSIIAILAAWIKFKQWMCGRLLFFLQQNRCRHTHTCIYIYIISAYSLAWPFVNNAYNAGNFDNDIIAKNFNTYIYVRSPFTPDNIDWSQYLNISKSTNEQ